MPVDWDKLPETVAYGTECIVKKFSINGNETFRVI